MSVTISDLSYCLIGRLILLHRHWNSAQYKANNVTILLITYWKEVSIFSNVGTKFGGCFFFQFKLLY